jgi:Fe-S cluster assembly iron-binding protein IscA
MLTPQDIQLEITEAALQQIQLIKLHDYTLEGLDFRIKIGGKGCGGFTYSTGFSAPLADDLKLIVQGTTILMDPFTAFYTKTGRLDYSFNAAADDEGFIVDNFAGDRYKGKFFKDQSMVPNWEHT